MLGRQIVHDMQSLKQRSTKVQVALRGSEQALQCQQADSQAAYGSRKGWTAWEDMTDRVEDLCLLQLPIGLVQASYVVPKGQLTHRSTSRLCTTYAMVTQASKQASNDYECLHGGLRAATGRLWPLLADAADIMSFAQTGSRH